MVDKDQKYYKIKQHIEIRVKSRQNNPAAGQEPDEEVLMPHQLE